MTATTKTGRAGRRPTEDGEDVRSALLDAARKLFSSQGYDAVPVRQIAESAGVNAAMIHYYFGDKQGLYEAMLEATLSPLFARLQQAGSTGPAETRLHNVIEAQIRTLAENPWIPSLVLREVIAEGGKFRQRFVQQFAGPSGGLLAGLIAAEQAAGRMRSDVNPAMAALSLVSMMVFPFVAMPITSRVFGMRVKDEFMRQFIEHTERLFKHGALPGSGEWH